MAIIDFFDRGWRMDPTAVAYQSETQMWTYDDAGRMSCRIAHALRASGVVPGSNVAVLAPNAPLPWICVLGIWRAGYAWVPLNPHNSTTDNARLMDRFDVDILFHDTAFEPQLAAIRTDISRVRTIALSESDTSPSIHEWTATSPESPLHLDYDMDDVVMISPTGGTTGQPKGVMNTHRTFSVMVAHQMMALQYSSSDKPVNLAAAPMTHSAGILTLQTTSRGGRVVIIDRASPEAILPAIEAHGVTEVFLPPTVIYRLLDVLDRRDADLSSLRYLLYGAAPMSLEKLRSGIEKLGPVFIECYGQMEAVAGISFLRPDEHMSNDVVAPDLRLSSCGRPYPLISVAIKDPDTNDELAVGLTGEICVRGDLVMKGYYKDPEQTARTLVAGWLRTGDLGHLDSGGFLHLTDRRKDMIISGGSNIYPGEVEQVIWKHPAVQDCAVVGAPDDDWGERVIAVVELRPGLAVDARTLIDSCRSALGSIRTPKEIHFVDQLPRSVNGKVLKKDVRQQFWVGNSRAI